MWAHDRRLYTPGPLTTTRTVKEAMLRDLGSRDDEFVAIVADIRQHLLALAEASSPEYAAVLMQGSGTFALESVVSSVVPREGRLLVLVNGAYGHRMVEIARVLGIDVVAHTVTESEPLCPAQVAQRLRKEAGITHVAVVHCETTTGLMNPIREIGHVVSVHGASYIIDAMSSFGAVPLIMRDCAADYVVSSANKCIQGVPGFSFVLARTAALLAAEGRARSVSLDLVAQFKGFERDGQFRFTPPTHALLAFHQALREIEEEGGVAARGQRYARNHAVLTEGLGELGFVEYLRPEVQGYIITSYRYPTDSRFDFEAFYQRLRDRGHVIYPGKVSNADCFRIGHIGALDESDMRALVAAVRDTIDELGVAHP